VRPDIGKIMNHSSIIVWEGMPFIISLGILVVVFAFAGVVWAAAFFLIATLFVAWFFRNPERNIPEEEKAVISPADGKILKVEEVTEDTILKGRFLKISIFMSVFNVHVNRIPYSGRVDSIVYRKGKFFSANLDKASSLNEGNSILVTTDDGQKILTVQIAGLIARRIVCWIEEGMTVEKGQRFGLIRFGSRLEVFLPLDSTISVKVGDSVKGGETPIGYLT
jgi:phosphatidylserine decarboxylase